MKSTLSVTSRDNTKYTQNYGSYPFIFNPPSITIHARLKHAVEQYDNYPILEYYQDIIKYYLQSVNTFYDGERLSIIIGKRYPELMGKVYKIIGDYGLIPVTTESDGIKLYNRKTGRVLE